MAKVVIKATEEYLKEEGKESVEEKLARLEEQNLILMDAIATMFEEILILRGEE